jgi:CheY-like chemotaxis protein
VLIVDDNSMNRFVLSEQLLSWGIHGEMAEQGDEALEILQQFHDKGTPFDIAILDYAMPEMNGVTLAKHIKNRNFDTSLVLLSSINNTFTEQQLQTFGFQGYLLKPAAHEIIHAMLQVLWAGRGGEKITQLVTRHNLRNEGVSEKSKSLAKQHNLKVLLVEDNIVNQQVAKALLEKQGCVVYIANNGLEALEKAAQLPTDLIFMDMLMPEMNGLEATVELRKSRSKKLQEIPIIALTANATLEAKNSCVEAGMNDFLSKPFRPHELAEILEKWATVIAQ